MAVDLDLVRARNAFAAAQAVGSCDRETFLNLSRKLPAMLQTNGLLAAWAFLLAREGGGDQSVRAICRRHLGDAELSALEVAVGKLDAVFAGGRPPADPLSGPELQRLTAETIAFAGWLKRAAEAVSDTGEKAEP